MNKGGSARSKPQGDEQAKQYAKITGALKDGHDVLCHCASSRLLTQFRGLSSPSTNSTRAHQRKRPMLLSHGWVPTSERDRATRRFHAEP